jgi:DNA-binding transcriptional ArsR family regulator
LVFLLDIHSIITHYHKKTSNNIGVKELTEQIPEVYSFEQEDIFEKKQIEYYASLFKALGDDNRQKLLHLLRKGEKCVSDLLPFFKILQPTVSTHLLLLEEAGILKVRRLGRKRMYSIADPRIYELLDDFALEVRELIDI